MAASRGRRSGAELAIVPVSGLSVRPAAPEGYSDRERAIWDDIVHSLAVDWFQPGDLPILDQYVKSYRYYQDLTEVCDKAVDDGRYVVEGKANPVFGLRDMQMKEMLSAAVRLRLTQSTKWTATKGATNAKKGAAAKLWVA
jgi:hypothetical protein